MRERKLYLLALSLTKGLGPVSVKNMIAYCGSAKAVFETPKGKLVRAPGIGEKVIALLNKNSSLKRAEKELAFCEKQGIQVLSYLDADYPNALKYIHDAPLILFKKGKGDLNAQANIAIVGTRQASDYGIALAESFADFFAKKGINVVSGLAFGVDISAHRAVLKADGMTTAVLGHGLDNIYPGSHRKRAAELQEKGALLSEYLSGTKIDPSHFPARNRIVSGISKAIIVVEAAKKGGALITARFAFDQDRQVYAIPGRVGDTYSAGCNQLIRENVAKLISDPAEVLEDLQIKWQQHEDQSEQLELALAAPKIPLSPEEAKVLNFLGRGEAIVDKINYSTGIPMNRLNALLLSMEFKELLRQMPGKRFRRV